MYYIYNCFHVFSPINKKIIYVLILTEHWLFCLIIHLICSLKVLVKPFCQKPSGDVFGFDRGLPSPSSHTSPSDVLPVPFCIILRT